MILHDNVTLIVTTCNLIEGTTVKCEQFWPDEQDCEDFAVKKLDYGVMITHAAPEVKLSPHLILRQFEVTDSNSQKTLVVKQLHYVGWPDHGVPTGESMNSF